MLLPAVEAPSTMFGGSSSSFVPEAEVCLMEKKTVIKDRTRQSVIQVDVFAMFPPLQKAIQIRF
jgi:hypothetical protein